MGTAAFLAVDWGTTNRRAYAMSRDGVVLATDQSGPGVLVVPPGGFAAEVAAIRARLGDVPMLCAGMVGSTRGWVDVPYLACPVSLSDLAGALHWVDPRTAISPGVSFQSGPLGDVMRGEEVQFLGAVASAMVPADALLCQPGTHCKWARVTGGALVSFQTTMTGEMFALLGRHSLLTDSVTGEVVDGAAFAAGLDAAKNATLLRDLFEIRASAHLGLRPQSEAVSYLSGLLIGTDVREQHLAPGETVHLLADSVLGGLYRTAISAFGGASVLHPSHDAFGAGVTRLWNHAYAIAS